MKRKILSLMAVAVLVLAVTSVAKADSATFDMSVTNGWAPSGSTYATVSLVLNADGTVTVTVTAEPGVTLHGNNLFGLNVGSGVTVSGTSGVGCVLSAGGAESPQCTTANVGQLDGFGSFNLGVAAGSGGDNVASATFTISGHDGNDATGFSTVYDFINPGNNGYDFGAQVGGYSDGSRLSCTGFIGNGADAPATGPLTYTGGGGCNGSTPVPEPGSLMLFGTGLLSAAGFMRRKLFS
jgi:PEP-CTERM motif